MVVGSSWWCWLLRCFFRRGFDSSDSRRWDDLVSAVDVDTDVDAGGGGALRSLRSRSLATRLWDIDDEPGWERSTGLGGSLESLGLRGKADLESKRFKPPVRPE